MTKKTLLIISTSSLLIAVIGLVSFHGRPDSMIVSRALNAIDSLQSGKYPDAEKDFHPALRAMRSPEALGQEWTKTVAMFGPLKSRTVIGTHATTDTGGHGTMPTSYKTVELSLQFEKGEVYAHVPFDSSMQIAGLMIDQRQIGRDSKPDPVLTTKALSFIDSMQAGNYQEAQKQFYSGMKARLSPEALGKLWERITTQYGPLKSRTVKGTYVMPGARGKGVIPGVYRAVELDLVFEKGSLYGHIPFDPNNEITGLSITKRSQ